ncbi:hypothetical protein [Pseudomonas phage vB_PaeM_PS119XW]|uniref:Uncharacterized protein n=1 Tax=Pseudomonas phage vB_PaeM_PS119XW TaxID=2601632 RepID=A0A5C1K913_9CAUD|nr:hypothetical protein PP933_gp105 [Pseudomonas phage vB_PaeM_PS119XW]QEM41834.1 hypothetical protein [Pseudomonas phage vB_PaeM_PS119XW]
MPHAIIPLPDVYETVMRKVSVDAIRQIATMMQLPGATRVYLPGRVDTVPMNDGMFGNCCDAADAVHFDPEERITVAYEEIAEENFTLSTAVYNNENFPLFVDDVHDITIRPIRRFVDFRIDIEYQAPNVVLAQRWLDDQRIRCSAGGAEMTMSLTYHYNVPPSLLGLMKGLYDTMQKSNWPTDLTFREWMEKHWCQPQTEMATLASTHPTLSIYERQVDVVGWFDFSTSPDTPQKSSDNAGGYTVNFSYLCRYERPTHMRVNYPILMNQCTIPKVFRPEYRYQNYQAVDRKTTSLRGTLDHQFLLMRDMGLPYIQHPDIDDWHTDQIPPHRFTFFNGLLCLSKDDLTSLMDFKNLGRFTFNPYWLEFIQTLGTAAIADGSFFEIRLYQNNERLRVPMTIDPGTTLLRTTIPLDPLKYYHIQISLSKNFYGIHDKYWEMIRRYPTTCWSLFRLFRVSIGRNPIEKMELLGLSGPRPEDPDAPGEGTTPITSDLPNTFKRGIVKWGDIAKAREEQDKIIAEVGASGGYIDQHKVGPLNVLFSHIISDIRS